MLTVDVLERFPEAREKWQKALPLRPRRRVPGHEPRPVPPAPAPRRAAPQLCAVGDPDQSIYGFRGADIRNILEFEHDFPGTRTIALEQNYRSTQHDPRRGERRHRRTTASARRRTSGRSSATASRCASIEVEDEHAEARFVAAEIALLVEEGFSGSEIAVFYRTNAQSRVLEDVLVRQGIAYQVIGGPRFYERAEIKDLDRLPPGARQPVRRRLAAAHRQPAAPRHRRHELARLQTWADQREISLWEAIAEAEKAGVGAAPQKALKAFRAADRVAHVRRAWSSRCRELIEEVLARSGYMESLEAERTIEAQGRIENLQELVARRARVARAGATRGPTLSSFLQEISLYSDQDAIRGDGSLVTLMTLHNAKGLEFRAVYLIGMEEGIFPHSRSIEEQGDRGGAAALLRRDDAREGAADADARVVADALRRPQPQPAVALPRRAARRARRARAARPASWSGYGAPRQSQIAPREDVPDLSTGDSVRHSTLGEGVVMRIEPGGVVTVRFADDGSERKLMLDYAPLEKL